MLGFFTGFEPTELCTLPTFLIPPMSEYTSISTDGNQYPIEPLDDIGKNYQTWLMQMGLILQGGDVVKIGSPIV